jgi:comEA protein
MERKIYLYSLWVVAAILYSVLSFTNYKSNISSAYASSINPQTSSQDTTRILISSRNSPASVDCCVNVNSSQAEELLKLPGVGPVLAERILKFRDENGPFKSIDELDKVKGIGPSKLERLRSRICFK